MDIPPDRWGSLADATGRALNLASTRRVFEARDGSQQGGPAAPRWSKQSAEFVRHYVERDVFDRADRIALLQDKILRQRL
jgi:hypothetical protein